MADRPILFSAHMVRALLEGRKTMTRRVLKPQPFPVGGPFYRPHPIVSPREWHSVSRAGMTVNIQKVPYAPGDRLWVREAFAMNPAVLRPRRSDNVLYRADVPDREPPLGDALTVERANWLYGQGIKWKPSIHMPRWASRLTLTVTDIRVQRLQEIRGVDCIAEGVPCETCAASWSVGRSACNDRGCFEIRHNFRDLWNSLHGDDAWDQNPWVTAISFTVERRNIDA